jgi:hypothetical protein
MTKPYIESYNDISERYRYIKLTIPEVWFVTERKPHTKLLWLLLKMWWKI